MRPLRETRKGEFSAVKYVLTDIDDTLTYHSRLSAQTYTALERLQNAGIKVIPVTAAPAGWCDLMVRMWPIDAVIGENGGLYSVRQGDLITRMFWLGNIERLDAQQRLLELERHVGESISSARISDDQKFRLTSFSWERPSYLVDMN